MSVPVGLPTIPTGFRGLAIGRYVPTPGAQYHGEEYVSVYLGVLDSPGTCPAVPSSSLHPVSGVGTAGGNPVILLDAQLPMLTLDAIDLHDMKVITPSGFHPGFGSLFGSERVWSFALL
jgi:hypothetical protein